MMGLDLGEMFLNFPLDMAVRPYCGLDLHPYFQEKLFGIMHWEHWLRCVMGLPSSPYCAIKTLFLGYEMVTGNRRDPWYLICQVHQIMTPGCLGCTASNPMGTLQAAPPFMLIISDLWGSLSPTAGQWVTKQPLC